MKYNYEWVSSLKNNTEFRSYPLQFANLKRIEKNNVIYIFDEVGTGKTITSGLMASHYVYNTYDNSFDKPNNYLDALVITINSNVKDEENKGFEGKWRNLLGFKNGINYKGNNIRIEMINNHYSNINKIADRYKEIGVLVIDEAHLFVGEDRTERREALERLRANKIIYLTATPIKYSSYQFNEEDKKTMIKEYNRYNSLSICILNNQEFLLNEKSRKTLSEKAELSIYNDKDSMSEYFSKNITVNNELKDINYWKDIYDKTCIDFTKHIGIIDNETIAERFDCDSPVTRYFKSTISSLMSTGKCIASKSKRCLAEIVTCNSIIEKPQVLANYIMNKIKQSKESSEKLPRFVVFTRQYWEQEIIAKALLELGFSNFYEGTNELYTYKIFNGKTKEKLELYKEKVKHDITKIPRVLIITYQIAEAGVDLPSFNYIINYYISQFPSSLEQRFGRIDRLDSDGNVIYEEITMTYLLSTQKGDTNTVNFYSAIDTYLRNLNAVNFPVKNVLFDSNKKVVNFWNDLQNNNYKLLLWNLMIDTINDDNKLLDLFNWHKEYISTGVYSIEMLDDAQVNQVAEFIYDKGYKLSTSNVEEFKNILLDRINRLIKNKESKKIDSEFINYLQENSDKIFYYDTNIGQFSTLDASECAKKISESDKYKEYLNDFYNREILPKL